MNPQFQPVRPVRAYEAIVRQVEEAIYRGDFQPGQHLPSEKDLMHQFHVSRATIREALRVLENAGFIKSHHGSSAGGAIVQEFSTDLLQKALVSLISRTHKISLIELLQFRLVIESTTAYLVAMFHTKEQLEQLLTIHNDMKTLITTEMAKAFQQADTMFHQLIADSAQNELFRLCHHVVLNVVEDVLKDVSGEQQWKADLMQETWERHDRILHAIQEQNGYAASNLILHDLSDHYASYIPDAERSRLAQLVDSYARQQPTAD
jgi:GntR family transcriptional repressor for pyruvate dehydrogenase complex